MTIEEERKARKKERDRRYREKNKTRLSVSKKAYYEANKVRWNERVEENRKLRPEQFKATRKAWLSANKDRLAAYHRVYRSKQTDWQRALKGAKILIARVTGLKFAEIPQEMAEAKAAQILLLKELRRRRDRPPSGGKLT